MGGVGVTRSVVVLGQGSLCCEILDFFHASPEYNVVAVVPSLPEREIFKSLTAHARALAVPVMANGILADLEGTDIDLGFSCFYNRILSPSDIERFGLCLNLHNGPLPRYRGVRPINWALENRERSHGVTIHRVATGIDTGAIYGQCSFTIDPDLDEVIDVYRRCLAFGLVLFRETIPRVWTITPEEQDEDDATYFSAADADRLVERVDFTREVSRHGRQMYSDL